ncbi:MULTISPECIES: DMT family transporter [unclassified Devosia]|uniref:DMT family transporter n=1 Tax=unclassified Devosia TaxID=196773 RepID=UPI00145C9F9F|nr:MULTISPECIES: DMT family transporter [unclassified Devosia]MBJ6986704.1 DMT family transporter [Devosia sp. MC521]QMW61737.1 DMT family transporter [Devosia sp. MC521]
MIGPIISAFVIGLLIILSRQVNGRVSVSTTPLISSFWNHIVGFVFMTILGLAVGGLIPENIGDIPLWVYSGGAIGVIFVAAGSFLITKIGATNTTLLLIAGQMISSVVLDMLRGVPLTMWASVLGIVLILAGMALTQRPAKDQAE